jgi:2-polyprenyl-3-methyl-5-hydroxy-6-metoxy-1,4-benzoquinol methylase
VNFTRLVLDFDPRPDLLFFSLMKDFVVNLLRKIRFFAYAFIEPLDFLWRKINKMPAYPPIRLRRHAGSLGTLDGPGHEFTALLKLLTGLKSGQKIWDMGCGCGLLELVLEQSGWRGQAIATDIHRPSITWAQKSLSAREPSFVFLHADIYNKAYWPKGRLNAHQWLDQFQEKDFDLIIAKSFFTHVLADELDAYLSAVAQRLKPDKGRALLTFFILDPSPSESQITRQPAIRFHSLPKTKDYALKNFAAPSAAVAYNEDYLRRKFMEHNLSIQGDLHLGWWRGYPDGLSFQDFYILQRKA